MAENHVLLETISLTQSAASVIFDNIPQTGYTDLKIVASMRVTDGGEGTNPPISRCEMTFNSTGTNYSIKMLYGLPNQSPTANAAGGDGASRNFYNGAATSSNATANTFSNTDYYISNYTSSSYKSFSIDNVTENNATAAELDITAGVWNNNTSITSIKLNPYNLGSFAADTTFSLYGIAAFNTVPVVAPKATGGNIVANDGTYWYHAFTTSGNFVPQTPLTCNILQVAGGGGGSTDSNGAAGGGGAGGLLGFTNQSLTAATVYPVVVGAGGAAYNIDNAQGTAVNGSNSQFASLTASIGGGGGSARQNALSGGSGGGVGDGTNGTLWTPGSGTAGQGYAGGGTQTSQLSAGGGGGATAAGGIATAPHVGGIGGTGSSAYSAYGLATNTGHNVSGTVYYAGGGGGATYDSGPGVPGAGGAGGGGAGAERGVSDAVAGIPGTGGGGGGGSSSAGNNRLGKNGGSGIVIIRYAMA
jgi:hypothetical protein